MSVRTKKLPTDSIEIWIGSNPNRHFIGPKTQLNPLMTLLLRHQFQPVQESNAQDLSISWEALARERIQKYTKPGLALRGARLKERYSQTELAQRLGISQSNLSKMERGKRTIGKKMAQRLGTILRINYRLFL